MENNYVTAKLVQQHVLANPFIVDYLSRDLINVASLARELLPLIQRENSKATVESISVAIRRLPRSKKRVSQQLKDILSHVQITMRTDISLFCLKKGSKVPDIKQFTNDDIFYVNQGANEITIIIDDKNEHLIIGDIVLHRKKLAILSLKDTLIHQKINYRITPGFVNMFLSNISKEGINVEDIISTYSQVTFVIEEHYLPRVFDICNSVKQLKYV